MFIIISVHFLLNTEPFIRPIVIFPSFIISITNFLQMSQPSVSFLQNLSTQINLPVDIIKTILVLFVNMPLGSIYMKLNSPQVRQLYSLVIGLIELFFLLQIYGLYVVMAAAITFAIINIFKKSPFGATVICSVIMLTIVHLHRFIFDYSSWKMDCSVYMMILVTKLTYYGFAVKNGRADIKAPLQYFSYCFFFPSLLVGPTFSFERYLNFINLHNQYTAIKFSFKNTATVLAQGLLFATITAIVMPIFDHEWVVRSVEYNNYPLVVKLLVINIIGFCYRIKFYAAWYLCQVTVNLSGLSYSQNGLNDSVVGGSIMFEFEPNPKNKTEYWNSSIQSWLKTIVYDNIIVVAKKNQSLAVFGTFLVSACWHGIYLTYYFGFFQWAVLVQLTKFFYKLSFYFPQKFRQSKFATFLVWIAGTITMNYIGMAVVLLEWENMAVFYSGLYYCITIGMVIFLILSFIVKTPKQAKNSKGKDLKPQSQTKEIKKD